MAIRGARSLTFQGVGVYDSIDGTNAPPGALATCTNLIPSPSTAGTFVPRPAATLLDSFTAASPLLTTEGGAILTTEGGTELTLEVSTNLYGALTALIVVGTRAYGMASSVSLAGHDVPFCYDLVANTLVNIGNVVAGNTPVSPASTGDWSPPTMQMIANRIVVTHPGFDGVTHFVGWIDLRGYTYSTGTGSTHSSTLLDTLSFNPWLLDVQAGDAVSGAGIPADTDVVATTSTSITRSPAATASAAGVALTFTSGTFAAPVWGAGQLSGNVQFSSVPTAVAEFNGRAYYAVGNVLVGSDSLIPLQTTNTNPLAIVLGSNAAITALGGLPLANQVVGGVIQSLVAFKGGGIYYQITGDPVTNNLAANAVAGSVGTIAPNSVTATPLGLAYVAPDGLRIVGLDGKSSEPIGADGQGVAVPFINAVTPTRINAAYNQNVLRISVQNGAVNGQPYQEWWYHFTRGVWTGPHSFPATMIAAYTNSAINTFIMAPIGVASSLWRSDAVPSFNSVYVENGAQLNFVYQTSLLPDNQSSSMNSTVETTEAFALPSAIALTILALDEAGNTLGVVTLSGGGTASTVWDAFTWGSYPWGGSVSTFKQHQLAWQQPVVFKQLSVRVTGQSLSGFILGNIYASYQVLRYLI